MLYTLTFVAIVIAILIDKVIFYKHGQATRTGFSPLEDKTNVSGAITPVDDAKDDTNRENGGGSTRHLEIEGTKDDSKTEVVVA